MPEIPPPAAPSPAPAPLLPLGPLLASMSDGSRWRILRLLAAGEPLMVTEIARSIGLSDSATAKHLAVLREAGMTQVGRGRLQQLSKNVLLDKEARTLDFGYFLLRLGVEET